MYIDILDEERKKIRKKFRDNFVSNPYPEYIGPPWENY